MEGGHLSRTERRAEKRGAREARKRMSAEDLRHAAVHEASHALVGTRCGAHVAWVRIGGVDDGGKTEFPGFQETGIGAAVAINLSGEVGESLMGILDNPENHAEDIQDCLRVLAETGCSEAEAAETVERIRCKVAADLRSDCKALSALTAALLERGELSGDEVRWIIAESDGLDSGEGNKSA
jgi:hypothetical protein